MVNSVKHSLEYVGQITESKSLFNDEISPENDETLEVLKGEQVPN